MLETLSPQEAMTLFRNGGAFFVDVRTEKEFLKRAIPGCPLVPLDKLEREGGLDSRFSGKPVVFSCRSGSRTQNKAELLERSASGKAYQLGGGILAWEQAGFPVWNIRELLPCFAHPMPTAIPAPRILRTSALPAADRRHCATIPVAVRLRQSFASAHPDATDRNRRG